MSKAQTKLMQAQNEMQMSSMIFNAKESLQKAKSEEKPKKKFVIYAVEELAKVYEIACLQYLKQKIDGNFFETIYVSEIAEFAISKETENLYRGVITEYKNTLEVVNNRLNKS